LHLVYAPSHFQKLLYVVHWLFEMAVHVMLFLTFSRLGRQSRQASDTYSVEISFPAVK